MADEDFTRRFDEAIKNLAKLQARTHAGTVLYTTAFIDEELGKALLAQMRELSERVKDRIFGGYGALDGLSRKTDIAYAFKFIDQRTYDDLRVINSIRNRFAHPEELWSFDSDLIKDMCNGLSTFEAADGSAKEAFQQAVASIMYRLHLLLQPPNYLGMLTPFLEVIGKDQPPPSPDKSLEAPPPPSSDQEETPKGD
jgi:DNA-binding MltR family transcriptional regulator